MMELHSGGELFDRIVGRPRFTEDEVMTMMWDKLRQDLSVSARYLLLVSMDLTVVLHVTHGSGGRETSTRSVPSQRPLLIS